MADQANILSRARISIGNEKTCIRCHISKALQCFSSSRLHKSGIHSVCKACRSEESKARYHKDIDASRDRGRAYAKQRLTPRTAVKVGPSRWLHIKRKYGLSMSEYMELEARQEGSCAVCKTKDFGGRFKVLCVDHCHETGRVRGLLCARCNSAIGSLGDTESSIRSVLHYLTRGAING